MRPSSRRRLATPHQKASLMHLQDGRCGWCRESLEDWEAHHINGFASGGETTIKNLSLLCVACHRKVTGMSVKLRRGQLKLKEMLESEPDRVRATCQFPTGYGKTLCIALAYSIRRMQRICNRLLVVVANDTQLEQALGSLPAALDRLGVRFKSVRKFTAADHFKKSWMDGEIEIVVTTIQMVHSHADPEKGSNVFDDLFSRGQWMLAADEFHHYGEGMAWGDALKALTNHEGCQFRLALSATPSRDGCATIFDPVTDGLRVSYQEAISEGAVKRLLKSSFEYVLKIQDGPELKTSDIKQAIEEYGDFTEYELKKSLRYNPGYCTPLIREPAARLRQQQNELGRRVQMLVRALSCKHAEYLAESLTMHFNGLTVDWVGSGLNGRPEEENKRVLAKFKPDDGSEPTLDVLVQVGMASEGFDSVYVTEIVDFQIVTLEGAANQTKQFIGRGSRVIPGLENVPCYVNVGTDHPIATGKWSLNEWMDSNGAMELLPESEEGSSDSERDWLDDWEYKPRDLDFEPLVESVELQAISIESSDVRLFASNLAVIKRRRIDLNDPVDQEDVMKAFYYASKQSAKERSEDAIRQQASEAVEAEKRDLAFLMLQREKLTRKLSKKERSAFLGEAKTKISAWLKRVFRGSKDAMKASELRDQALMIQRVSRDLKAGGALPWE